MRDRSPHSGNEAVAAGSHADPADAESSNTSERVEAIVRALAREVGGDRAANAVSARASLERDVGLGSLERVELLMRLEGAFGRELGDRYLLMDNVGELANHIAEAPLLRGRHAMATAAAPLPATHVRADHAPTLVEALRMRATAEPTRIHVQIHENAERRDVSYAELWDGARRIAAALTARGIHAGETVAIMLPTGLDFLQSFMGVLAARAIAVPLYPPARLDRLAEYLQRQSRILDNAGARLMIAMPEAEPVARLLRHTAPVLEAIVTAESLRSNADALSPEPGGPSDPALIQYTSGSTGEPKGVLLSHANLLANIRAIAEAVRLTPSDVAVSWLPLYHDMGLIGTWLNSMVNGIPLTLMSPLAFLARPERWLWAIHDRRATLSPAPNFAYEFCVRKVRDEAIDGLDLSSWRLASNGSEPVSAATMDRFVERFAKYGFRRQALAPVYGLAESAVALCVPPMDRGPVIDVIAREPFESQGVARPALSHDAAPLRFASVGTPLAGHDVKVVDERGVEVPPRKVGRLLFRGPSCMIGYYRNPEATARVRSPDGWIDSGDFAYRSPEGELFITGRIKDLIIKGGRNLVPQEIEEVVGSINGVRRGCVVAFGVADESTGTERLVVIAESRETERAGRERIEQEIVARVASQVGVPPDVVSLVMPGGVPKTPSGKIRRAAARAAYEAGTITGPTGLPLRLRLGLMTGAAREKGREIFRRLRRGGVVAYLLVVWTVGLILLGPVAGLLLYVLPRGRAVRALGRVVSRVALAISGCRVHVDGRERVPRRGPAVLVANHTSYADTPVLAGALPRDFVFTAMAEIMGWRLIRSFVRRGEHPTVDRWHLEQSVADAASIKRRLGDGDAVLFFAEGGFSRARGLRPFRLGAFEAAVSVGAPVVPIALRGVRQVLAADTYLPRPGRIDVWIGTPIMPVGNGWSAVIELRNRTADAIAGHCGEPRLDVPKPVTAPVTDSE